MLCPWGQFSGFWACFDECNESTTFLVLGPIDLTNGRASMADMLQSTLRGTTANNQEKCEKNVKDLIILPPVCRQAPTVGYKTY
jgi:hypothetical protein